MIAGAIIGVAQVIMVVDGLVGYPSAVFNLMTGATVVAMALVVWLAIRWPEPITERPVGMRDTQRRKVPAGIH